MAARRWVRATATVTIPVALAVQSVLALGTVPPPEATPEAPERGASIDPGFSVRFEGDVDSVFIADFEDRSNDSGFIVGPGALVPTPSPAPATPEAPATVLGSP